MVPNKPLREAFERSGLTAKDLSAFMGIKNGGDIKRTLGIHKDSEGRCREEIDESIALRYIRAMNLDPIDFDL